MRLRLPFGRLAMIALLAILGFFLSLKPSNDRDWSPDQAVLPEVVFEEHRVRIRHIRDARYRSTTDYDVRLFDAMYDLNQLDSLWYIVEPFGEREGAAHTFVSFGFDDGRHLAISAEIRKEKGESFSALKGLLKRYELMYVIGTEADLIGLRANERKDDIFLYPIRASRDEIRAIFVSMLERANALAEKPEFYDTLMNTCMTNLVSHFNAALPTRIPTRGKAIVLPGYSDPLFHALGLIDTDLPPEALRERYKINERAESCNGREDFSLCLRAE